MAKKVRVKVEGLRQLNKALNELTNAASRGVLRRVGLRALVPMRDAAVSKAPVGKGKTRDSIQVSTKRPKGAKSLSQQAYGRARGMGASAEDARSAARSAGKGIVEIFMGPGRMPQAVQQEFGNVNHPPQPFMRPAWDAHANGMLEYIKSELTTEVMKAARRHARRMAKRSQ